MKVTITEAYALASHLSLPRIQNSFWAHVIQCPHLAVSTNIRCVIADNLSDAKVNELEGASAEHKVSGFEVTMYNPLFMHSIHRFQHLLPHKSHKVNL